MAKSWFLAIEAGLQADAARETIRANEELVRLADERARIGVGNQADVYSARATVGGYRDLLRQLELAREEAIRALELMLGRYPAARRRHLAAVAVVSRRRARPGSRQNCSSAGRM